jgi:hypothetical protein
MIPLQRHAFRLLGLGFLGLAAVFYAEAQRMMALVADDGICGVGLRHCAACPATAAAALLGVTALAISTRPALRAAR